MSASTCLIIIDIVILQLDNTGINSFTADDSMHLSYIADICPLCQVTCGILSMLGDKYSTFITLKPSL